MTGESPIVGSSNSRITSYNVCYTKLLRAELGGAPSPDPGDRLWGLSWRVRDADAARARLLAAGFDVSPVRKGRRPGTRVLTVRDGTHGVPTLFLEPQSDPRAETSIP